MSAHLHRLQKALRRARVFTSCCLENLRMRRHGPFSGCVQAANKLGSRCTTEDKATLKHIPGVAAAFACLRLLTKFGEAEFFARVDRALARIQPGNTKEAAPLSESHEAATSLERASAANSLGQDAAALTRNKWWCSDR